MSIKQTTPWQIVGAIGLILIVGLSTLWLMRPMETMMSFTPLSGLITLKSMATDAIPYEIAIANHKPTLIEFYADWCTTCQAMSPTMEALHRQYAPQINFVMLNVDQPQWAAQVSEYSAFGVPQFTLLDSEHHEVHTWVGKIPRPIFKNIFEQVLG